MKKDIRYQPNVKHKLEGIILILYLHFLDKCSEWAEIEVFAGDRICEV